MRVEKQNKAFAYRIYSHFTQQCRLVDVSLTTIRNLYSDNECYYKGQTSRPETRCPFVFKTVFAQSSFEQNKVLHQLILAEVLCFAPMKIVHCWRTLCSPEHFAPWEHFKAAWYTLHLNSLSYSEHFGPQHTLLLSKPCSLDHFSTWNTSLYLSGPGTRVQNILRRESHQGAKCSRDVSVPRSRVFQKAKCAEKQSVPRSRVF